MPETSMVFIVDDDDAVRESLAALLESVGFNVRTFASGESFLKRVDCGQQGCLILDIRMSGLSGLEVQEQLNARHVTLPVIIMTGHADVPMAVKAMKAGAIEFIEKPFKDDLIIGCVHRALLQDEMTREQEASIALISERLANLTPRERQVLEHIIDGTSANKLIARKLGISPRTVEIHRARVMEKLQAKNLSDLIRMAIAAGIDSES